MKALYLLATLLTLIAVLGAGLVLVATMGLSGLPPLWQKLPLFIELGAFPLLIFLLLLGNVVGWFPPEVF